MSAFTSAFDDLAAALDQGADSVVVLSLDQIVEDPANPRSNFDEAEIAALAETIRVRGVLQPITVGPADADGRYPLRFGARRLRAARVAGLNDIKALVRAGTPDEAEVVVEQVIENDQRAALTTAEMARAVARLLKLGKTQAEVGRLLGRPKDQIAMLAAVAKAPPALEPLGSVLGLRTLYELVGAWKQDRERVERWVESRDPATITQADARNLVARSERRTPERDVAPSNAHTKAESSSRAEDTGSRAVRSPKLRVKLGRRQGSLVLDRPSGSDGRVHVRFDDADDVELVAVRELKLLSLEVE